MEGSNTFLRDESKANFRILEDPKLDLKVERGSNDYSTKIDTKLNVVTMQFEYLSVVTISKKIVLGGTTKFSSIKYREWTTVAKEFNDVLYPSQMKPLKLTESHKLEIEILYDASSVIPNNTYLLLSLINQPKVHSAHHFDPVTKKININFGKQETFNGPNGKYQVKIIAKSSNDKNSITEWDIGSIDVDLSTGGSQFYEKQRKGPLKGKEIKHIFAPELVYAPSLISIPVGGLIIVVLLIFLVKVFCLGIKFNNLPESGLGKLYAFIFIVLLISIIDIALSFICSLYLLLG